MYLGFLSAPIRNLVFLTLLAFPAVASAEEPSSERAAAQVLFDAGRAAMDRGDYDEACAKFLASQRADPAPGTLLNLGNCEEKQGRIASAWERYRGALGELKQDDPRHAFAKKKITELKASVPHLTVTLEEGAPKNTQVWRNDTPISGSLGIPLPLNPGSYEIVVEAPGHQSNVIAIDLALGDQKTLTVAPGEELPKQAPAPPVGKDPKPPRRGSGELEISQSTWGYVVGGFGVAGLGTALALGAAALPKKTEAEENCAKDDKDPRASDQLKIQACSKARSAGNTLTTTSTIVGSIGIVAIGVGAYLLWTDDGTTVQAGSFDGYHGVRVRGVF